MINLLVLISAHVAQTTRLSAMAYVAKRIQKATERLCVSKSISTLHLRKRGKRRRKIGDDVVGVLFNRADARCLLSKDIRLGKRYELGMASRRL